MPAFTYTGDAGRYYPELNGGVVLNPGDTVEVDQAPDDGRFTTSAATTSPAPQADPPSPAPAPDPVAAPAADPAPAQES